MSSPRRVLETEDIPARFLAEMLLNSSEAALIEVWSEEDAVLAAEAINRRNVHPNIYRYSLRPVFRTRCRGD